MTTRRWTFLALGAALLWGPASAFAASAPDHATTRGAAPRGHDPAAAPRAPAPPADAIRDHAPTDPGAAPRAIDPLAAPAHADPGSRPAFEQGAAAHGTVAAPHATEHAEHEEHEEHGPPPPINWFDFGNKAQPPYAAMLINFALLLGIYYFFGKKPIGEALKNRRATVAKEIEEAQRMKREAEARAERYQAKLAHLEEELAATKQALIDAGKGERDRIIRDAEEKAARMQKDAMFRIEQELKQVRSEIMQETIDVTVAAAEELLRRRVTPADQERLAEDYLAEITAKAAATAPAARGGLS